MAASGFVRSAPLEQADAEIGSKPRLIAGSIQKKASKTTVDFIDPVFRLCLRWPRPRQPRSRNPRYRDELRSRPRDKPIRLSGADRDIPEYTKVLCVALGTIKRSSISTRSEPESCIRVRAGGAWIDVTPREYCFMATCVSRTARGLSSDTGKEMRAIISRSETLPISQHELSEQRGWDRQGAPMDENNISEHSEQVVRGNSYTC